MMKLLSELELVK